MSGTGIAAARGAGIQPRRAFGTAKRPAFVFSSPSSVIDMPANGSALHSLKYLRRPRRPKWSARSSFLTGVGLIALITPLVLLTVHRSIWEELEIVTGALAVVIFGYLSVVLYHGVRFDRADGFSIDWPISSPGDIVNGVDFVPIGETGVLAEVGAELGPIGAVIGFILDLFVWMLLAFVVALVIWVGLNVAAALVVAVVVPVFYFYRRSLRFVVVRGRTCRGSWPKSALYAAGMTLAFTVWFYLIFFAAHQFTKLGGP